MLGRRQLLGPEQGGAAAQAAGHSGLHMLRGQGSRWVGSSVDLAGARAAPPAVIPNICWAGTQAPPAACHVPSQHRYPS